MGPEFKAGYRACLIQTGHKLTLNLILGPDLLTKNNVFVRSLASAAAGASQAAQPRRPRSTAATFPRNINQDYDILSYNDTSNRESTGTIVSLLFWEGQRASVVRTRDGTTCADLQILRACREFADHTGKTKLRPDPCHATYALSASEARLST